MSDRSSVLAFFVVCALLYGTPPLADYGTPPHPHAIWRLSPGYFAAGVSSSEFKYFAAPERGGRQRQQNWCWAATVQMVLNYHGLYVSQEQIVGRIFGNLVDRPGQPHEILEALSGWAPDIRGRFSSISATTYTVRGSQIVEDLAHR